MASVDHIESSYTLMSERAPTENGSHSDEHVSSIRPRTKSTPTEKAKKNGPARRMTTAMEEVYRRPSRTSTDSLTPLISDTDYSNGSEHETESSTSSTETPVFQDQTNDRLEEDTERREEEDDILTPLSRAPSRRVGDRPRGILKRSTTIESNGGSFSVQSPSVSSSSSISSPPISPTVSINRGGWRRESKVQFQRPAHDADTIVELQSFNEGRSSEMEESDPALLEVEEQLSPRRNRLRSSLTRLRARVKPPPQHRKLQRLQSQLDLDDLSRNELELKANLYFHIGNPIKRWKVDRVVPIKLLLQLLKTFCLVVQVILFTVTVSHQRSDFFYNSRVVFESLFIKNFQNGITDPRDAYVSYSIQDMYCQFEYISRQYFSLPDITIGGYDYESVDEEGNPSPLTMELRRYKVAEFDTINNSYNLDGQIETVTFNVRKGDNITVVYLNHSEDPLFHRFVSLVIKIPVKNIRVVHPERAECFLFHVSIKYVDEENVGKITYSLNEEHIQLTCDEDIDTERETINITYGALSVLDVMTVVMCCLSIILTVGSLRRATKLAKAMGTFYRRELSIKLSWWERRSLFPLWHLLNTISDLLIIVGSVYKIFLDHRVNGLNDANPTSLLLGTAVLFQAGVILRYISYFKELNALTRTIYLAFPELLKFLLCAGILFIAFVINGWIILGPYHEKFFTFNDSLETLFSLINGDDIYNTFILIDPEDDFIAYLYSRFYMYVFLVLFLYFVLNLFTSLVISAHEASQTYDTAYDNEVRRFVFSGPLTARGAALRDVTSTKNYVDPEVIKKRLKTPPKKPREDSWKQHRTESDPEF